MMPIRPTSMARRNPTATGLLALAGLILLTGGAAAEPLLPRPASLEPAVRFWTRVYTEVDDRGGFIHDSVHLDVVYETVRYPEGLSRRGKERHTEKLKDEYRAILRRLAKGKRTGLSGEEQRVLAQWPEGVSNSTLRAAAGNVRFQLGQAGKFRAGLARSGQWRQHVEATLAHYGVPTELVALPHVESSYYPKAYSRVGAAGMWQFTRGTGRLYMRVDYVVDERLDPYDSTDAAARLLRDNYKRLKSWPLAITAYNHGTAGMARAARKLGTRDMGEIVKRYKSRTFGFASRNFYASFLAALDVDRNAGLFFGPVQLQRPIAYREVTTDAFYKVETLVRAFDVAPDVLQEHNPGLRPSVWNGSKYVPKGFRLRIPREEVSTPLATALAGIPAAERLAEQHRDRFYKVRRGDTLSKIAKRFRVRERTLVSLNNLRSRHRIRVGQVLVLPDGAAGGRVTVARQEPPADGIYRIRRGDTISIIAKRFGVSQNALARENNLRNRHRISVGQKLRIPGVAPRTAAPKTAAAPKPAPKPEPVKVAAAEPAKAAPKPAPKKATPEPAPEPAVVVAPVEPEARAVAPPAPAPAAEEAAGEPLPVLPIEEIEVVEATATDAASLPTTDPSNYSVARDNRVVVQADETLGHYADWLEVKTQSLRRLNGMRYQTPVVIGRKVKLDFSRVTQEAFELRRLAYHRSLQEDFFQAFQITGTEDHELRRGESVWYLANRKYRVPVWLLRQYNPDVDFGALPAGARLVIPVVEPRQS